MARIKISKSKNSKSYSLIEDYYRNGKKTSKFVHYIGNYTKVSEMASLENVSMSGDNNYKKIVNLITKVAR